MSKRRQKSNRSKLFQQLPNEIFAEIFSYLNGVDAVFAFSQLNHRFQCLIFEYCQSFDFESISKFQFDLISQLHNTKRWKSIRISDDQHTPNHIEYFCQFYSLINDFPQLQSLSIMNIDFNKNYTILSQLPLLTNLVSLKIETICGENMFEFDLPNLKRLVFTSCTNINWIKNFSQVESIEYTFGGCYSHENDLIWPLKLKYLKVIFWIPRHYDSILRSVVHLTSLRSLEVYQKDRSYYIPNGKSWENLICSSLPLLKIFKFYFDFESYPLTKDQLKEVIASFSTPFFIHERKWFIHCDIINGNRAVLFSIPFIFEQFTTFRNSTNESISTFPENDYNDFYNNKYANVKTLQINHQNVEPDENFNKTKILNLIVNVDFNFVNWLHVFSKLRHLDIISYTRISSKNFCLLLNTTSHLCSLSIKASLLRTLTEDWSNVFICNYLSQNIRFLNLHRNSYPFGCLSKNEFQQIIRIFSSKCQHLSLSVQSPNDTIPLILQNMSQLHSLHVYVNAKHYEPLNMIWLEQQKTKFNNSNCMIVNNQNDYYFWL